MFKSIIINKSDVDKVLYEFTFNILKSNEDWIIGGGFARFFAGVFFDLDHLKYENNLFKYFHQSTGDIDLFSDRKNEDILSLLPKSDVGRNILELTSKKGFSNNFKINSYDSKFANNIVLSLKSKKNSSDVLFDNRPFNCKFQYVNAYHYNNPEDMLNSFDINNSQWCLKLESHKLKLIYTDKALLSDKSKHVSISSANKNPYLSERILKYTHHRGMSNGVSDDSYENLKKYILTIYNEEWENQFVPKYEYIIPSHFLSSTVSSNSKITDQYTYESNRTSFKSIQTLLKCNSVTANDLALFVGKWKVKVLDRDCDYNYDFTFDDKYIEVDWATRNIRSLSR